MDIGYTLFKMDIPVGRCGYNALGNSNIAGIQRKIYDKVGIIYVGINY